MGREILAEVEKQVKPSDIMSWIEKLQFLFKGMDHSGMIGGLPRAGGGFCKIPPSELRNLYSGQGFIGRREFKRALKEMELELSKELVLPITSLVRQTFLL
jgi:hypothetical protein